MKRNILLTIVLAGVLIVLAGCGTRAAPTAAPSAAVPQVTLVVSGSGGATPIVEYLSEAYSQQHSDLSFKFLSGAGTSGGVKGVIQGQLDLGSMSRPPKDSELEDGIGYAELGIDRIAIATSPDIVISGLTSQQVKDIFLGAVTNWSQVGGPEAAINILVRDEEDSMTVTLREGIFGEAPFATSAVVLTGEGDMKDALAKATLTIGFMSYSGITLENLSIHAVAVDGLDPTDPANDYPYFRQMGVAYLPANLAKVQPFLDFITSAEAKTLLKEKGILPVK